MAGAGLSASTVSFAPTDKITAFQMDINSCCLAQRHGSSAPTECSLHACEISNWGRGVSLRYDIMSGEETAIHFRDSHAT